MSAERIKERLFKENEDPTSLFTPAHQGPAIYRVSALDNTNIIEKVDDHFKKHFFANFINFLSYRSQGNPKKLGELFGSLVYPAGRVFSKEISEQSNFNNELPTAAAMREHCQNVLYFSDTNIIRIQLLSQLFGQLEHYFHESLAGRDDKVIGAIFYLSDFLFKFHKRAFAWDSL